MAKTVLPMFLSHSALTQNRHAKVNWSQIVPPSQSAALSACPGDLTRYSPGDEMLHQCFFSYAEDKCMSVGAMSLLACARLIFEPVITTLKSYRSTYISFHITTLPFFGHFHSANAFFYWCYKKLHLYSNLKAVHLVNPVNYVWQTINPNRICT